MKRDEQESEKIAEKFALHGSCFKADLDQVSYQKSVEDQVARIKTKERARR